MSGVNMLVALLLIGIMARSNLIATAACLLLIAKFTNLKFVFSLLERRGLEMGILFLMLSILVPLANGKITEQDIIYNLTSLPGILSIAGGALATCLNTQGLKLLKIDPEIVLGWLSARFWASSLHVPVGPLMAAAVAALFTRGSAFRR